jgi:hypothetical protein
MNLPNDIRIETFRQTVERLTNLPGALETLAITLHRANELPGLIASTPYPGERKRLREEQTAIGYPLTHRIRQAQWESELRQGLFDVRDQLRAAIDAATEHVGIAAGGAEVARSFPFARSHLNELARHRVMPSATESVKVRLAFLGSAWQAIDAALASLCEISFDTVH